MKAKLSCRPTPQRTTDSLIARLCFEKSTQTRSIETIPSIPVNRSMNGSAYHFKNQFALFGGLGGNAESVLDLLGSFLDILFGGVVNAAKHGARIHLLADLDFQDHPDRGIDIVFFGVAACADQGGGHADVLGRDCAHIAGAR